MKVRALARGQYGGILRHRGETFNWVDGEELGTWVEPLEKPKADKPKPKGSKDKGSDLA